MEYLGSYSFSLRVIRNTTMTVQRQSLLFGVLLQKPCVFSVLLSLQSKWFSKCAKSRIIMKTLWDYWDSSYGSSYCLCYCTKCRWWRIMWFSSYSGQSILYYVLCADGMCTSNCLLCLLSFQRTAHLEEINWSILEWVSSRPYRRLEGVLN